MNQNFIINNKFEFKSQKLIISAWYIVCFYFQQLICYFHSLPPEYKYLFIVLYCVFAITLYFYIELQIDR